jgi:hypothetical protein
MLRIDGGHPSKFEQGALLMSLRLTASDDHTVDSLAQNFPNARVAACAAMT